MQEILKHNPNNFCWIDLATTDTESAKKFYCELFGLTYVDIPSGENQFYTMLQLNNKSVSALSGMNPLLLSKNIPPHWMSYICVEDAKATVEKAKQNGAEIFVDTMDVMEEGRFAFIQDPEGGAIGIWEPIKFAGSAYKNVPGTLCWVEYGSHNRSIPIKFYEAVFGWTSKTEEMGGTVYTTFFCGEEPVAGLYEMPENMADVPPHWLSYFAIENIDKSLEIVAKYNAVVLMPKIYLKGIGYFAVVQDPQEAVFGIIQNDMTM